MDVFPKQTKTRWEESQVVSVSVVLGLLSHKCQGKGICSMSLDPKEAGHYHCRAIKANITVTRSHWISLIFEKADLCDQVVDNYFGASYFEMPESFIIPFEIMDQLGIYGQQKIKSGCYKIFESPTSYQITFN